MTRFMSALAVVASLSAWTAGEVRAEFPGSFVNDAARTASEGETQTAYLYNSCVQPVYYQRPVCAPVAYRPAYPVNNCAPVCRPVAPVGCGFHQCNGCVQCVGYGNPGYVNPGYVNPGYVNPGYGYAGYGRAAYPAPVGNGYPVYPVGYSPVNYRW